MSFKRLYLRLFLLSIILPIHISFYNDFSIYFDRDHRISIDDAKSFPISFFFAVPFMVLWSFQNLKHNILIYSYLAITSLPLLLSFGFTDRHLIFIFHIVYFFSLKYVFERINNSDRWLFEINLNYYLSLYVIFVFLFFIFGRNFGVVIFDLVQYVLPVLGSFCLLFFLQKRNILVYFLAGFIYFWILSTLFKGGFDSVFFKYSAIITLIFAAAVRMSEKLMINNKAIAILSFIVLNFIYFMYLFIPNEYGFLKSQRNLVLKDIFDSPMSFALPFFSENAVLFYGAHSFLFEGYRFLGIFFVYVLFKMIQSLSLSYTYLNRSGYYLSVFIFVVLGLISLPQLHLSIIPIILVLPYLNKSLSNRPK